MDAEQTLHLLWRSLRDRLAAKRLLGGPTPGLSLRIPGSDAMWFGSVADAQPRRVNWRSTPAAESGSGLHSAVYAQRDDVSAVAEGGSDFGQRLADFGGTMPGVFDEQVRHLGAMPPPPQRAAELSRALRGGGNVLLIKEQPVVLGMTGARLALNAELFEKCAKAYVLAVAGGGRVKSLPWIVRYVANRRLMKDEKRAMQRTRAGMLPEETQGY